MSYTCYIIDDEFHACRLMEEYVEKTEGLESLGHERNPRVALERIRNGELRPDIVFLDIEMKGMSGITFGELVSDRPLIVYTTGFGEYATRAYDLDAVDYLMKPIRYERFCQAVNKAFQLLDYRFHKAKSGDGFFFVRDAMSSKLVKVKTRDLMYIEGFGNFVKIHCDGQQVILSSGGMASTAEMATNEYMVQIHKKYIVNLYHLSMVYGNQAVMTDNEKLPISRRFRKGLLRTIRKNG